MLHPEFPYIIKVVKFRLVQKRRNMNTYKHTCSFTYIEYASRLLPICRAASKINPKNPKWHKYKNGTT